MGFQEARVLADDVHDVTGDHSLVVLSTLQLCESKEILDDRDKEAFFGLLVHGAGDRSDGPAERVAVGPRPLGSIHLLCKLLDHDVLRVDDIKMGEVDQALSYRLVELDGVALLDEFPDDLTLIIFHDQDFFRTDHLFDHDCAQAGKNFFVLVLAKGVVGEGARVRRTSIRKATDAHAHQWVDIGDRELLHFFVEFLHKSCPVLQADLKNLSIIDLADANEVEMSVGEVVTVR